LPVQGGPVTTLNYMWSRQWLTLS